MLRTVSLLLAFTHGMGAFDLPELPVCRDVDVWQLCSLCERMQHRSCLSKTEHMTRLNAYLSKGLEPPCTPPDKATMVAELEARNRTTDRADLELYSRNLYDHFAGQAPSVCEVAAGEDQAAVAACSKIAILVTGHPRTMLEPSMAVEYREVLGDLGQRHASVEVFAFVDVSSQPWLQESLRQYHGDDEHKAAMRDWEPLALDDVRGALLLWGVPFTLAEHHEGSSAGVDAQGLHPDLEAAGCPRLGEVGKKIGVQYAKVHAAAEMMKRAEVARGEPFDVVVRLRPDMCVRSLIDFFSFALAHTTRTSMTPFLLTDHTAVFPRWATELYAGAWRVYGSRSGDISCDIDLAWEVDSGEGTCSANQGPAGDAKCIDGQMGAIGLMTNMGVKPVSCSCIFGWGQGRRLTGCFELK